MLVLVKCYFSLENYDQMTQGLTFGVVKNCTVLEYWDIFKLLIIQLSQKANHLYLGAPKFRRIKMYRVNLQGNLVYCPSPIIK